jgi:hypothetical protein
MPIIQQNKVIDFLPLLTATLLVAITLSISINAHCAESAIPTFEVEVSASLTKLGCNSGTCHGSLHGKGGFRLSLRGQDPDQDYHAIAIELAGRRLDLLASEQSLLLAKPAGDVAHQGGLRIQKDSQYYAAIRDWIEHGAQPPAQTDAESTNKKLVSLQLLPMEQWQYLPVHQQQLSAQAIWSDGSQTDVTNWARYECSSLHGATVNDNGLVSVTQPIDTTISAFYLGQRASSRLVFVPNSVSELVTNEEGHTPSSTIDTLIQNRLRRLGISAEPAAPPELILRRIYLTVLGRLPRLDEQSQFLADPPHERMDNCIERVLADPAYAAMWALKWSDLLRNEPKVMSEEGVGKWHDWLADAIAEDKPVHSMVMEMITTMGSTYENPAASFHRTHRDPTGAAESIGQVFLGIRMQCAKCHNHPFDVWTQDDYYGLAAFLNPIERKQVDNMPGDKLDSHVITGDEIISIAEKPAVLFHPGRSKFIAAKGLGAPNVFASNETDRNPEDKPLQKLAEWIGTNNRQFARNTANRIWAHLMGRGIVDPTDDFRGSNPPSNPELLEYLTDRLIAYGYSTRELTREILHSQAFYRSSLSMAPDSDRYETAIANFAGYMTRRMTAEILHDAILDVSGSSTHLKRPNKKEDDQEKSTARFRAVDFPSVPKRNVFLRAFGKPERLLDCECERSQDLSLRQSLLLVNDASIRAQLQDKNGNIARWTAESQSIEAAMDRLFRIGLCRTPSPSEWDALRSHALGSSDPKETLEDIAWAVVNSKEFLFVR